MKAVANSTFKARWVNDIGQNSNLQFSYPVPASDNQSNLFRTRISNVMLRILKAEEVTATAEEVTPFGVFITDYCGNSIIADMEVKSVRNCFNAGLLGWSVDVGITTDGAILYPTGVSSDIKEMNLALNDLVDTLGGSMLYIWLFGASVPVSVGLEIIGDRVLITTDEYVANFATPC